MTWSIWRCLIRRFSYLIALMLHIQILLVLSLYLSLLESKPWSQIRKFPHLFESLGSKEWVTALISKNKKAHTGKISLTVKKL